MAATNFQHFVYRLIMPCLKYFSRLENSIDLTEALLPYVGVERNRDRGTKLVYLFLAKVQSFHRLTAQ